MRVVRDCCGSTGGVAAATVADLDRDVRTRAPASEESDDAAALEHGVIDILAGDLRTMRITGSGIR